MRSVKMTPTERACLDAAKTSGELNVYYVGHGPATRRVWGGHGALTTETFFSTQTVQRLVDRGLVKFATSEALRRPIKAVLIANSAEVCHPGALSPVPDEWRAARKELGRCLDCGHDKKTEPRSGHALNCKMHPFNRARRGGAWVAEVRSFIQSTPGGESVTWGSGELVNWRPTVAELEELAIRIAAATMREVL